VQYKEFYNPSLQLLYGSHSVVFFMQEINMPSSENGPSKKISMNNESPQLNFLH